MKLNLTTATAKIMDIIGKYFFKILPGFLFLFLLTGCQTVDVRGQYISDSLIEKIDKSNMTKNEILRDVGSPTYIPQYSENYWYYIQRSQTSRAWFKPKVVEQRVVKLTFNEEGVVTSAELVENEHTDKIKVQKKYTATKGTEKSGLQKFVGNFGRFNKSNSGKKKAKDKK